MPEKSGMEKSGIDGRDTDGMDGRAGIEMLGIDGTKSLAPFVMSCIRLRDGASCAPAAWMLAKRAARIMNRFIDFLLPPLIGRKHSVSA